MSWPILHTIKNVLPTLHVLRNTCSFKAFAPSVRRMGPGRGNGTRKGTATGKRRTGENDPGDSSDGHEYLCQTRIWHAAKSTCRIVRDETNRRVSFYF